jgi:F0F1-type ATP synthase epsilon subunit
MKLVVSTPDRTLELDPLVSVQFETHDGWRGIWPGHEPSRASLRTGPIRCASAGGAVQWVASEGGVMLIDRQVARVLTRWAAVADTLASLREQVEARELERTRLEQEARAISHRYEVATRRALMVLERKITAP